MDEESGKEDAGHNAEEKMNWKCKLGWHEWIILSFIGFGNIKLEYPNRRKCKRCGRIEECKVVNCAYMSGKISQEWHRIE